MLTTQLLVVLIRIGIVLLNEQPVRLMRKYVPPKDRKPENRLHAVNAALSGLVAAVAALAEAESAGGLLLVFGWLLVLQWLVFDPVLNLTTGRPWDYNGETADADQVLVRILGRHAGKIKATACLLIIAGLNWLYYINR